MFERFRTENEEIELTSCIGDGRARFDFVHGLDGLLDLGDDLLGVDLDRFWFVKVLEVLK